MAMNVNRWLKYAKARIDSAVGSGHESLDRLEAEQEAERADKPWLGSDSTAPTFDEARARIEWEADQQAKKADRHREGDQTETKESDTAGGVDAGKSETTTKRSGSGKADAKVNGSKGSDAEASGEPDTPHRRKTDVDPSATSDADRAGAGGPSAPATPTDRSFKKGDTAAGSSTTSDDDAADPGPAPRSPQQIAIDAERETARLELEDRQRKSAERLEQIRQELGIEDTPTP
ncbi:MAG: hypothetical protein ABI239_00505 [Aquihabitans sp.]